ncbi:MAG TPA: hypothetical protein VMU10_06825, partial [Desulfomonilia bacterium]|nr:hypothetical protein [Desulfomonilia bacterium]
INLVRNSMIPDSVIALMDELGADFRLLLPFDEELALAGEEGRSIRNVSPANPVLAKVGGFISQLKLQEK